MVHEQRPFSVDRPVAEETLEAEKLRLIWVLVDALTPASRSELAKQLSKCAEYASPTEALAKVIQLFPSKEVTAAELRQKLTEQGVSAQPKEIYNSIGYLAKTGALRRLGYGRYVCLLYTSPSPRDRG